MILLLLFPHILQYSLQQQYITFETFDCQYSYVESAMLPCFFVIPKISCWDVGSMRSQMANMRGYSIIIVGYMTS